MEEAAADVSAQRTPPADDPPLGSGSSETVSNGELQNFAKANGTPGQEPQAGIQNNEALYNALVNAALSMANGEQLAGLISQPGGSEGPVCIGGETSVDMAPSQGGQGGGMTFTDLPGGGASSRKSSSKPDASEEEEKKGNPAYEHPIQDAADGINQFLEQAKEFAIRIALDSIMPGAGQAYQLAKNQGLINGGGLGGLPKLGEKEGGGGPKPGMADGPAPPMMG